MAQNYIELNGNTYDIRTGKIVNPSDTPQYQIKQKPVARTSDQQVLDGFVRIKNKEQLRNFTPPNLHNKPINKSQTLMRTAVNKPSPTTGESSGLPRSPLQKRSITDPSRMERAARSQKSNTIQKFSNRVDSTQAQTTQQAQKRDAPAIQTTAAQTAAQPQNKSFTQNALDKAPDYPQEPNSKQSFTESIRTKFQNASSTLRYSMAGVLMISGLLIIGYVSMPHISMRIAATRSGVATSIPSYKPAGFQLDNSIAYSPGQVALSYSSVSDNRSFRIHKEKTDWSSESLRSEFVEGKGLYQTIPSKGKTIYIYNENNATWVDGGIWYNVEGASSLSSDQLLRIANGL